MKNKRKKRKERKKKVKNEIKTKEMEHVYQGIDTIVHVSI
jgi:hypothetical protein